jgi:para-aminobenzoate synthetase/4-amino-4-deoxychorismate lyase
MTEGHIILHKATDGKWLSFRTPRQIIAAYRVEEILPALDRIENLVNKNEWHAAGFISYEAAGAFDEALCVRPLEDFPLLWFGLYQAPELCELPRPDFNAYSLAEPIPAISRIEYDQALEHIKEYIKAGDTYQVNYTLRLRTLFRGDSFNLFLAMVRAQSAGYAAWIDNGRYAICSASPELFFRLEGDILTCKPMKGTVRRGHTLDEDRSLADWLHHSEKNRAENLMIVDMIRNDLGRIADVGSVQVSRLFEVERHPTLWQMTSTIKANCRKSFAEIIKALFPCASITGAPKIRTTHIIAELEQMPRGIYTGCIGYFAPSRKAQFSVAIRTAVIDRHTEQVEYGSGGGIVWDSVCKEEYKEALLKARVLTEQRPEFSLLETMLWTPEESYFLLDYHLRRLANSADYFDFPVIIKSVRDRLSEQASQFPHKPMRVRLLAASDGTVLIQSDLLNTDGMAHPVKLMLANKPINSSEIFLYHKTTYRKVYEDAALDRRDCDDVLLWNERGEITESRMANFVFQMPQGLFTPPVESGLLAGTFRAWLLDQQKVRERVLTIGELGQCSKIFLINSVRKWQEAVLCPPDRRQLIEGPAS